MKKIILLLIITNLVNNANAQWQTTNGPSPGATVTTMAVNSTNLFANVYDGVHAYSNTAWSFPANSGFPIGSDINALFVSGTNLFAAFQLDGGVSVSPDSGASWLPAYNGLPTMLGGQLYAVHALNSSGNTNPIFAGTAKGVYSTLNNGNSWTPAGLLTSDVRCLANHGTEVFAGTYNSGVYYSNNNGTGWTAINNGLTDTTILSLLYAGVDTLFAGTIHGVFRTIDNGANWTNISTGLPTIFAAEVGALVKYDNTIIAGSRNGGVFTNTMNGNSWTANNVGFTSGGVYSLAIKGANVYAGIGQGGVWTRALSELTAVNELSVENNQVTIFPNPVTDVCTISINNSSTLNYLITSSPLKLYDVTGRAVLQQTFSADDKIDLSILSKGVYIIELNDKEGRILNGKIVKQ